MSNPFDQFDGTDPAGNPFDGFTGGVPVDSQEQDVIHRTNHPAKETPSSFGLTEIPVEVAKGFTARALSLPDTAGGLLVEAGDLSQGMQGKSTFEVAKQSFITRLAENIAEGDTGIKGAVQSIWGAEKDALLSLFSDGSAPKVMKNAGNALVEQNQAAITALGLSPKGGSNVSYDIGAGFASIAASVGSTFITKNPEAAAAYMTAVVNSQDYREARAAGKDPEQAAAIAAADAYGQGMIEMLGGRVFLHAAAGSTFMRKVLTRAAGQAAEEGSQAVVEESVKDVGGVRNKTMAEKIQSVAYQAMIGFVVGAPVSAVVTKIEERGKAVGLPDETINEVSDNLVKSRDQIIDAATVLIDKETAGVTNDEPARAETLKAVKGVFAEQAATEQAVDTGATDNPKIAAKLLLESPEITPSVKQQIKENPGITMDELQALLAQQKAEMKQTVAEGNEQTAGAIKAALTGSKMQAGLARWRELTSDFRKGVSVGKAHVKEAQQFLVNFINDSELDLQDKGKFLATVKNIQNAKQLQTHLPEIEKRLNTMVDAQRRREAVAKIKSTLEKAGQSTVAVDFTGQVSKLANEVDTTKHTEATKASLKKTLEFMQKNPGAEIPRDVREKVAALGKKPIEQVSTQELEALAGKMEQLVKQGKTKLSLMESQKEKLTQKRIEELKENSVPLSDTDTKKASIGERLSTTDRIKNRYIEFKNRSKRIGIALNPMDVFFDMLDGGKNYRGSNHSIFKQTVDKSFSKYLNLKEDATRAVKELADKLNLNEQSFEKIGAYAVLQQEGGEKKLLDSGISQEELNGLTLTKPEMQMYQLMRAKLDAMLPGIKEVMRTVYNQDVDGVKDYFPFMTDHEAMHDFEIQDQLGDKVPIIGKKKNVEKGFTESRTLGKQKIRIDALGVFLKHVDNAAYLTALGGDIKALGDVAGSKEYGEAVGDIGQEMVVEWINLLARKGNVPGRIAAIDTLRRNVGFAVLGFKLSSFLVQPTALADGAALVGGDYVAGGVFKAASPEWRQFLWDNFPEVRERAGDDPAYLDMGGRGIVNDVRQAGFWALKKIDALTASAVAAGAYTKSVERKGGEVDLSNPDPEAIAEAQLMMRRTQSSSFAKDVPAIATQGELTGNVSVDKLIFQFQSFMLNRWSLLRHDMWRLGVKQGNTAQALNIAAWLILATAAEIGVRRLSKELVDALLGHDTKPWEDTIKKEAVVNVLQTIPFVSQAVSAFEYGSVPAPALAAINQIGNEMKLAAQSKHSDTKAKHLTKAALLGAGVAFGVPGTVQATQLLSGPPKKRGSSVSTP